MYAFTLPPPSPAVATPTAQKSRAEIIAALCAREECRQRARAAATRAAAAKWAMELAALRKPPPPRPAPLPLRAPVPAAADVVTQAPSIAPILNVSTEEDPVTSISSVTADASPIPKLVVPSPLESVTESAAESPDNLAIKPAPEPAPEPALEPVSASVAESVPQPIIEPSMDSSLEALEPSRVESVIGSASTPAVASDDVSSKDEERVGVHKTEPVGVPSDSPATSPTLSKARHITCQAPFIPIPVGISLPSVPSVPSSASFLNTRSSWGPANYEASKKCFDAPLHEASSLRSPAAAALGTAAFRNGEKSPNLGSPENVETMGSSSGKKDGSEDGKSKVGQNERNDARGGVTRPVLLDLGAALVFLRALLDAPSTQKCSPRKAVTTPASVGGVARPILFHLPSKLGLLFFGSRANAKSVPRTNAHEQVPMSEGGVARPLLIDGLSRLWADFMTLFTVSHQMQKSQEAVDDRFLDTPT